MVRINLANLVAITLMAAGGFLALKWSAAFVPSQGYRDIVGGL